MELQSNIPVKSRNAKWILMLHPLKMAIKEDLARHVVVLGLDFFEVIGVVIDIPFGLVCRDPGHFGGLFRGLLRFFSGLLGWTVVRHHPENQSQREEKT